MAHGHTSTPIQNPGPFRAPAGVKTLLLVLAVAGIGGWALALKTNPDRAWSSLVINHFFFFGIAICGLFFASIQWLTSARWSAAIRRIMESFTAYLPFALLSLIAIFFGIHHLYHWSHPEVVQHDAMLSAKSGYLNTSFFIVRNVVAFVLWFLFTKILIGNSLKQDQNGDASLTLKNKKLAPIFLITFAVTFTMAAFDLLMSLDPHWFSTMFGVYAFAGSFYASLATMMLVTLYLRKRHLAAFITDEHVHGLGKFMFAFSVFWAYIAVSQFLLIWYANIPEETGYFLRRSTVGGWLWVSIFLLVGKFFVPFFLLMRRVAKRNQGLLVLAAIWMLAAHWIDLAWIVQPEFFKEGLKVGWIEVSGFLGFGGVFALLIFAFLSRNNAIAIKDPYLAESLHHHQ